MTIIFFGIWCGSFWISSVFLWLAFSACCTGSFDRLDSVVMWTPSSASLPFARKPVVDRYRAFGVRYSRFVAWRSSLFLKNVQWKIHATSNLAEIWQLWNVWVISNFCEVLAEIGKFDALFHILAQKSLISAAQFRWECPRCGICGI